MKTIVCTAIIVLFLAGALVEADPHYRARYIAPELHNYDTYRHRNVVRIESVAQINPAYVSALNPDAYDTATQANFSARLGTVEARLEQILALLTAQKTGTAVVTVPSTPTTPGTPSVIVVPPTTPGPITVVPPPRPAGGGKAAGLAVLNGHCVQCHQAEKLYPPDQKFTLLTTKGDLVTLTAKQEKLVSKKIRTFQMPPPGNTQGAAPLTDVEYHAVADLLGF